MSPPSLPRPVTWAAAMILVTGFFWLLILGRALLIPLVLAFLAVYLIEIITRQLLRIRLGTRSLPAILARSLAILIILGLLWAAVAIVAANAGRVIDAAPQYQKRALEIYEDLHAQFSGWTPGAGRPEATGPPGEIKKPVPPPDRGGNDALSLWVIENIDLGAAFRAVASGASNLVGNAAMVLVYLFFLLLERKYLQPKLVGLVPDEDKRATVEEILAQIDRDTQRYVGVKSFVSALTALGSYLVMRLVGLDLAEFFALLIFLFNFIPNLGSFLATAFPTLLALFQFDSFGPFLVVGLGITAVQLTVANLIEPPLMGKSLNLSPLVVILSLVFWGMVWGVPGMFLCVPLTVIAMIVLARNPNTRWVAVLLSQDGKPKVG